VKQRNIIITLILVTVILVGGGSIVFLLSRSTDESTEPKVTVTELDNIEDYGYRLEDRDTALYKENFNLLAEELKKEEVSFEEYAKLLSKLYVMDLYTISNKINQYDVGSLDFVSPDVRENFEKKVKDTIYKYVEDNTYGKRSQELPEVKSIEVSEITEEKQKVGEEEFDGYSIDLTWEYVKDLGYDKKATLKIVKQDKFLYVIKQAVEE